MLTNEVLGQISNIIDFHYQRQTVEIQLSNFSKWLTLKASFGQACASGQGTLDRRTAAKWKMFLSFVFEVNRFGFRCFVCNFQAVVPRTINFDTDVQVDEVTSVLKFELITKRSPFLRSNF